MKTMWVAAQFHVLTRLSKLRKLQREKLSDAGYAAKVWHITGSTHGLGRARAKGVLEAGHKLVATARDPEQLSDMVARYGDRVRAVALDMTNGNQRLTPLR